LCPPRRHEEGDHEGRPTKTCPVSARRRRWMTSAAQPHPHPGRYVGAADVEDDGEPFEKRWSGLTAALHEAEDRGRPLDNLIWANLEELGYGLPVEMSPTTICPSAAALRPGKRARHAPLCGCQPGAGRALKGVGNLLPNQSILITMPFPFREARSAPKSENIVTARTSSSGRRLRSRAASIPDKGGVALSIGVAARLRCPERVGCLTSI